MTMTAFTFRDINFDVMNVEPWSYQFGHDDSQIQVTYQVPYYIRFFAKEALLGKTTRMTNPAGDRPYLSRLIPHQWPESVAATDAKLYCNRAAITGFSTISDVAGNYVYAKITASYRAFMFPFLDDLMMPPGAFGATPDEATLARYVEYGDRETEGRIVLAFGAGAYFCNPDSPGPATPDPKRGVVNGTPFPYYEETINYIWHQVPVQYAPIATISGMINKINNAPFDVYTARTLMLVGFRPVRSLLQDQTIAYNIQYKIKHNPKKWDHLPDPANGMRWDKVVKSVDTTQILFEEDDFGKLFRPL